MEEMTLTVEFWTLVGLVITGLGSVIGIVWKLVGGLLGQAIKRIDDHFLALETAQEKAGSDLVRRLSVIEKNGHDSALHIARLERDLLKLQADLPLSYVRRDDYLAAVKDISSKLDLLTIRIEKILIRGADTALRSSGG